MWRVGERDEIGLRRTRKISPAVIQRQLGQGLVNEVPVSSTQCAGFWFVVESECCGGCGFLLGLVVTVMVEEEDIGREGGLSSR